MTELEFLRSHLPQSDLDCYADILLQFAEHGAYLRHNVSWCKKLEQELFDHYVLCPRVNDEELSFYGKTFFDALWQRIAPMDTMEARILEVNRWCGEMANYQMHDDRTASALTVYRNGSGRCGEESVFLVAALRSVGIPARQVYAPRWAHCDDNHAWVEAWCDGNWRFLGACEPEPVLDRGWFNTAASRALLVHSRTFGESSGNCHGSLISGENGMCWYNQTSRYAKTRDYRFHVCRNGSAAPGAKIHIQVLNESSFHTIATLAADGEGCAQIEMGLGDFHILAVLGNWYAETDCTGRETVLELMPIHPKITGWHSFDMKAPDSSDINESNLNETQKHCRTTDREICGQCRMVREETYAAFAHSRPQWEDLLLTARGNRQTIARFLEEDDDLNREKLLRTLSAKDLRDVTPEVLHDHLRYAPLRSNVPEDIYNRYVMCPRIGLEPLRPWRQALSQEVFPHDPVKLWTFLEQEMELCTDQVYANIRWTPLESWRAGRCDEKSRKLLFVAILRSLGIPARLRSLDGKPEFWENGAFRTLVQERTGMLRLTCRERLIYKQNWTLSRWTGKEWKLLNVPQKHGETELPAGQYRLITTRRMPNGNQFAACQSFDIGAGETVCTELYMRPYALEDILTNQKLPPLVGFTLDGSEENLLTDQPGLLLWLEAGAEPTEHLTVELTEQAESLNRLALDVTILLPSGESVENAAVARLIHSLPNARILLDDWSYNLETVARCMICDPDTPPLAVVCDGSGKAVFGASGYRVGQGKMLADIAAYIAE